jgi:hypothetical protein
MTRKSRTFCAFIHTFRGLTNLEGNHEVYYGVVAYDKKGREIPSSVNCCFNSDYYSTDQILPLAQAL